MKDEDRPEWDQAWSSKPHRRILDTTKVDFVKISGVEVGEVITVSISEAPKEYLDSLYIAVPVCPICGRSTEDDQYRVAAGVYPTFSNISGLGFGSYVHQKCLDSCPVIDGPKPIPW